mmetsp:Transcript_70643/g.168653  ORF Transcript_70643/g.168653 Transcript_70643/m.168653 type:complete len:201 (-) Transcript_70643:3360-3962(-)
MHLECILCESWPPSLKQEGLREQSRPFCRHGAKALLHDEGWDQGECIQGVDCRASAQNILNHGLLLRVLQICREKHEPRQHEEPRHPSEAPPKEVHRFRHPLCKEVAQYNVGRAHEACEAERVLVGSLACLQHLRESFCSQRVLRQRRCFPLLQLRHLLLCDLCWLGRRGLRRSLLYIRHLLRPLHSMTPLGFAELHRCF